MTEKQHFGRRLMFWNNLLSFLLLAALIAVSVYVNQCKIIVASFSTVGYKAVDIDTTYWNVACTVIGTAIGLHAAVAIANQDDHITRQQLANDSGVAAIFLRPLTILRSIEQLYLLQFCPRRTILLILTIVTQLVGAATVALLSISAVPEEIVNPQASYPLSGIKFDTFFAEKEDSSLVPAGVSSIVFPTNYLTGHLYKTALITGLKKTDKYNIEVPESLSLPEQGTLGDTIYGTLNTGGIGLNVSSYVQYSGIPQNFNMPSTYEFQKLNASVFGTTVMVACQNRTDYTSTESLDLHTSVSSVLFSSDIGPNFTFARDLYASSSRSLKIASSVVVDSSTDVPAHLLAIPEESFFGGIVMSCTYSGQDYTADVSVPSANSAIQIDRITSLAEPIDTLWLQMMANSTSSLISDSNSGGNLARGFLDAEFHLDEEINFNPVISADIETLLAQMGEAYISIERQGAERSNVYAAGRTPHPSELRLSVKIQRLGGANLGWLAVPIAVMIGSFVGVVQSCMSKRSADFEAQNAVKLLRAALHNSDVHETAKVRYEDGFRIMGQGKISPYHSGETELEHVKTTTEGHQASSTALV